jgi:hypothetical protein
VSLKLLVHVPTHDCEPFLLTEKSLNHAAHEQMVNNEEIRFVIKKKTYCTHHEGELVHDGLVSVHDVEKSLQLVVQGHLRLRGPATI